jgi:hypothetical protein
MRRCRAAACGWTGYREDAQHCGEVCVTGASGGVDPASILALTFSNRAAEEMRERIIAALRQAAPRLAGRVEISTFSLVGTEYPAHLRGRELGVAGGMCGFSILPISLSSALEAPGRSAPGRISKTCANRPRHLVTIYSGDQPDQG